MNKIQSAKEFIFSDNKNIKTHYTYYGRTKLNVTIFMLKAVIKKFYRKRFIDKNLVKRIGSFKKNSCEIWWRFRKKFAHKCSIF